MTDLPDNPVEAALLAERALDHAARTQLADPDPEHKDFYTYGMVLQGVLRHAGELVTVLARQISTYGDRNVVRADDGSDADQRLVEAAAALTAVRADLDSAATPHASAYQSAIGHVAAAVYPDAGGQDL